MNPTSPVALLPTSTLSTAGSASERGFSRSMESLTSPIARHASRFGPYGISASCVPYGYGVDPLLRSFTPEPILHLAVLMDKHFDYEC